MSDDEKESTGPEIEVSVGGKFVKTSGLSTVQFLDLWEHLPAGDNKTYPAFGFNGERRWTEDKGGSSGVGDVVV